MCALLTVIAEATQVFETLKNVVIDTRKRIHNYQKIKSELSKVEQITEKYSKRLNLFERLKERASQLSSEIRENWDMEAERLTEDVENLTKKGKEILNRLPKSKTGSTASRLGMRGIQEIKKFTNANTLVDDITNFAEEARRVFDIIFERVDRLGQQLDTHDLHSTVTAALSRNPKPVLSTTAVPTTAVPTTSSSVETATSNSVTTTPGKQYTVRPGDTLYKISLRECGNPSRYVDIHEANKAVIPNENFLPVGTRLIIPENLLTVPAAATEKIHQVIPGDTLSGIAQQVYGDPMKYIDIFNSNKNILTDPDTIFPGMKLVLPDLS